MALVMAEPAGRVKPLWASLWQSQARRIALWSPVALGVGVWLSLGTGGAATMLVAAVCLTGLAGIALALRWRGAVFLWIGLILVGAGFAAAEMRRMTADAPVLAASFRGGVEGRVIGVDRARSRAPRVVLDHLELEGLHASATPHLIRVTLVDSKAAPEIGARIAIGAVLDAPAGPAAPGAFDFSRRAYFARLGAVGYARGSVRVIAAPDPADLRLARFRRDLGETLRDRIGGEEGAVAAALIVGDRSEIAPETTEALRDSGLAHLLAISGLHIGLMSALTYWLVRFGLALFPGFASRVPIRKLAAVAGLIAAGGYLALSGFGVATQRAFIMAGVAFGAILIDRPAVTMRGVAAAACIILLFRPESLFDAGFQMSFAAVAALVAGYEATRPFWRRRAERRGLAAKLWTGALATLMTSILAGAATAPFAAYHFNRLAAYSLPANLLATPAMGLWIMPAIILAAALVPFGLEGIGLAILGGGIAYVLQVANGVVGLGGPAIAVPSGTPLALGLIVLGGLWLVIWRGGLRLAGGIGIVLGVLLWARAERPDILIARDAALIGGRTDDGSLWLSRERAAGYSAELWLRREGETADQRTAYARRIWRCDARRCAGETADAWRIVLLRKGRPNADDCTERTVLITPKPWMAPMETACVHIGAALLSRSSAIAITLEAGNSARIDFAEPMRARRQ